MSFAAISFSPLSISQSHKRDEDMFASRHNSFSREDWATFICTEFPSNAAAAGFFNVSVRCVEKWVAQEASPDANSLWKARLLQGASRFFGFGE